MRIFFVVFSFFLSFSVYGYGLSCDCEEFNEIGTCNPVCFYPCELAEIQAGAKKIISQKCESVKHKDIVSEIVSMLALGNRLKKAENKILEKIKSSKNLEKISICSDCSSGFSVNVILAPDKVIQNSCPKKHLITHQFKETYQLEQDCKKKDTVKKLNTKLQKYIKNKLDSDDLEKSCPGNCSYYTSYTTKIDIENCKGSIDLKVQCNDAKDGGFFSVDYKTHISLTENVKCSETKL